MTLTTHEQIEFFTGKSAQADGYLHSLENVAAETKGQY
jgi:hypothetical protein